eukprot:5857169-Pyramimonas_sp.AAC.1
MVVVVHASAAVYSIALVHAGHVVYTSAVAHTAAAVYTEIAAHMGDMVASCTQLLWCTEALWCTQAPLSCTDAFGIVACAGIATR